MKKINLEEILELHLSLSSQTRPGKAFYIAAMRQACNQAIDLCAENAEIDCQMRDDVDELSMIDEWTISVVDKDSILKTKDQIE